MDTNISTRIIPGMTMRGFEEQRFYENPDLVPFRPLIVEFFHNVRRFKNKGAKDWAGHIGASMKFYYFLESQEKQSVTGDAAVSFFSNRADMSADDVEEARKQLSCLPVTETVRTNKCSVFKFSVQGVPYVVTVGKVDRHRTQPPPPSNEKFFMMVSGRYYSSNFPGLDLSSTFNSDVEAIESNDFSEITGHLMKLLGQYAPPMASVLGSVVDNTGVGESVKKEVKALEEGRGSMRTFVAMCIYLRIDPAAVMKTVSDLMRYRQTIKQIVKSQGS